MTEGTTMMHTTTVSQSLVASEDDQFESFLDGIRTRFTSLSHWPLFRTDAANLFDHYLANIPSNRQQHYRCNACRSFFNHYAGLVVVDDEGRMSSVFWDTEGTPPFFREAARSIGSAVRRSRVTGVFIHSDPSLGLIENRCKGPPFTWRHIAVPYPKELRHANVVKAAHQAAAEKVEDFGILSRSLDEFSNETVRQAHSLLTTGSLYRSEKCVGVTKWLLDLHESTAAAKGMAKKNLIWRAVATAPAGFCHVRSSMIGTLLEDVAAGLAFDQIKRRFDEKMNPLQYQRPSAAPSAGNIAQAEKIVEALKSAGALERRFARLEDVQAIWTSKPKREESAPGGVFGHLRVKGPSSPSVTQPAVTMTWEKFQRTVLPDAESIEFFVPHASAPYVTLVTAANPDTPPILQWDREDRRNPVSWYFYAGGANATQFNMSPGQWRKVTAITFQPSMWNGGHSHQGEKIFFLLDGARDINPTGGASLFPETLRSEYHPVRATIEAYSRAATLHGEAEASACGIGLQKGVSPWNFDFRVTSNGTAVTYRLDRWD